MLTKVYTKIRESSPYIKHNVKKLLVDNHDMLNEKFIYIHIPKCAGTSLVKALSIKDPGHYRLKDYSRKNQLDLNIKKIAIVRHPFERIESTYNYAIKRVATYPYTSVNFLQNYENVNDFVKNGLNNKIIDDHYFFRSATDYISDVNGEFKNITIIKMENLSNSEDEISKFFGRKIVLPMENVSNIKKESNLNEQSKQKISTLYKMDINNFYD